MCTLDTFDRARKAHGTDHDILFVYSESESSCELSRTAEVTAGDTSHDVQ